MKNLNEDSIKELLLSENLEDQVLACTIMRKSFSRKKCDEIINSARGNFNYIDSSMDKFYVIRKKDSWGICTYACIETESAEESQVWSTDDPDLTIIEI